MDVVVHYGHSVKQFFCSSRDEFVVVIELYSTAINALKTAIRTEVYIVVAVVL